MKKFFMILLAVALWAVLSAQVYGQNNSASTVTYEVLYDDPETVKKLFVGFQPIIGELWSTNPSVGFGVDALYYMKNVADFRVHMRKPYAPRYDGYHNSAIQNSSMDNEPFTQNHFEFGGTYHIKDFLGDGYTRMVLYKKNYEGPKWTAQVPMSIKFQCKVRKIYGARLGGIIFDTTTDLDRIMERQGLTKADLINSEGQSMPETYINDQGQEQDVNVFGNVSMGGFYTGASMTWMRNVGAEIKDHAPGLDDQIITAYFDLLITPWINARDVSFQDQVYSVENIATRPVGFRLGMEGRNNRTLGWGWGGEFGYRPGFKQGGFFVLLKMSIPVFGTDLNYTAEAFEIGF